MFNGLAEFAGALTVLGALYGINRWSFVTKKELNEITENLKTEHNKYVVHNLETYHNLKTEVFDNLDKKADKLDVQRLEAKIDNKSEKEDVNRLETKIDRLGEIIIEVKSVMTYKNEHERN